MNFRMKCEHPEAIEYTMTITMTAGEWEQVRSQLDGASISWPGSVLVGRINDLLAQARKIYWQSPDSAGDEHG